MKAYSAITLSLFFCSTLGASVTRYHDWPASGIAEVRLGMAIGSTGEDMHVELCAKYDCCDVHIGDIPQGFQQAADQVDKCKSLKIDGRTSLYATVKTNRKPSANGWLRTPFWIDRLGNDFALDFLHIVLENGVILGVDWNRDIFGRKEFYGSTGMLQAQLLGIPERQLVVPRPPQLEHPRFKFGLDSLTPWERKIWQDHGLGFQPPVLQDPFLDELNAERARFLKALLDMKHQDGQTNDFIYDDVIDSEPQGFDYPIDENDPFAEPTSNWPGFDYPTNHVDDFQWGPFWGSDDETTTEPNSDDSVIDTSDVDEEEEEISTESSIDNGMETTTSPNLLLNYDEYPTYDYDQWKYDYNQWNDIENGEWPMDYYDNEEEITTESNNDIPDETSLEPEVVKDDLEAEDDMESDEVLDDDLEDLIDEDLEEQDLADEDLDDEYFVPEDEDDQDENVEYEDLDQDINDEASEDLPIETPREPKTFEYKLEVDADENLDDVSFDPLVAMPDDLAKYEVDSIDEFEIKPLGDEIPVGYNIIELE